MWLVHSLLHTAIFSVRDVKGVTRVDRNPGIEYQSEQLEKRFKQSKWIFAKQSLSTYGFGAKKKFWHKNLLKESFFKKSFNVQTS